MKRTFLRGSVLLTAVFALTLSVITPFFVQAQTEEPTPEPNPIPFVHTVAEGENMTYISTIYNVSVEDLLAINNLSADAVLFVGQSLIVPGGEGEAIGTLYTVQIGDTVDHVAAIFNTEPSDILTSNEIVNPYQPLLAGDQLIVVSRTGSASPQSISGKPYIVSNGDSWATIAASIDMSPRELALLNERPYPSYLIPGERLRLPDEAESYRIMGGEWLDVQLRPLPITQGDTVTIFVKNLLDGRPSGQFGDQPLSFFPVEDGFVALVGIDAFDDVGNYTLSLSGSGSQPWRPFEQSVTVQSGSFAFQPIILGPEFEPLLAPEVRQGEDEFLNTIFVDSAEQPLWSGLFTAPVTSTIVTDGYGSSRSYNGGPVNVFHSGIDFAGSIGTPILCPADGQVVFADFLELRGFSVIVDHGGGVMTAYYHLSEMFVAVGESVSQGQLLGSGGSTGLSTGPHLHWDLRVGGTAVDGSQWLQTQYP